MLLFDHRERKHVINWMVARHPDYSKAMEALEPRNLDDGLPSTAAFKNANNLTANMQIDGPIRSEFPNYQYDSKVDLHHCHVTMGTHSYDVKWEVHEHLRLIFVLDIAPRENFNYKRTVNKEQSVDHALKSLLAYPSYKRIFSVPNMIINPALKKMYEPFITKKQALPIVPAEAIVNMTADEVKNAQINEKQSSRARQCKPAFV